MALASALGLLTSDLRRARTMLWCCMQLGSCDLPSSCIEAAKHSAEMNIPSRPYPISATITHRVHINSRENKPLTLDIGTKDDADICDDDDDDVFTYTGELVDVEYESRSVLVANRQM